MKRLAVLTFPILLVLGCATAPAALPQEEQAILSDIQLLESNPLRDDAPALRTAILKFAADSPDVDVLIEDKFMRVAQLPCTYAKELAFQYIAGCVKFDLLNPALMSDPTADIVSGMESIVTAYAGLLTRLPTEKNAFLDSLRALKDGGRLTVENIQALFSR
jgi:hypothetical protein